MNASKPIDISKSSLISLKAELSRKQEEVNSTKNNKSSTYVCPTINPNKKPLPVVKKSKNIEKKIEDECNTIVEENTKALEHSRNVLEIKSKLYSELKEGRLVSECGRGAEYLVDFTRNESEKSKDFPASSREEEKDKDEQNISEDEDDRPSDPEEDWVDYTDVVGRSRRCLRRDLAAMRARDEASLLPPPPSPPSPHSSQPSSSPIPAAQLKPAAPHIEVMRQNWQRQEQKLLEKNSVHYEDILFNEARTHGVGYYAFSTDEDERTRQMKELERRRQETLRHQKDAEGLRARRDMQLSARLQAAKARNRQRLGLPPEEATPICQQPDDAEADESVKINTDDNSKATQLEASLKRAAHVRPWDAEKLGVKTVGAEQHPVMSQEEWVEKKREERISEFAPPEMYNQTRKGSNLVVETDDPSLFVPSQRKSLFFTSKKSKPSYVSRDEPQQSFSKQIPSQQRTEMKCDSSDTSVDETDLVKRKRTEIPPPLTSEYFGTDFKGKRKHKQKCSDVGESISEGLRYLNEQKKVKDNKRDKGLLDLI